MSKILFTLTTALFIYVLNSTTAHASMCETIEECQDRIAEIDKQKQLLDEEKLSVQERISELSVMTTSNGAIFTRDFSNPSLGEAWRDPEGNVWSDLLKDSEGNLVLIPWKYATSSCNKIGAQVPLKSHYESLKKHMTFNGVFRLEILPNSHYRVMVSVYQRNVVGYYSPRTGRVDYSVNDYYGKEKGYLRCIIPVEE